MKWLLFCVLLVGSTGMAGNDSRNVIYFFQLLQKAADSQGKIGDYCQVKIEQHGDISAPDLITYVLTINVTKPGVAYSKGFLVNSKLGPVDGFLYKTGIRLTNNSVGAWSDNWIDNKNDGKSVTQYHLSEMIGRDYGLGLDLSYSDGGKLAGFEFRPGYREFQTSRGVTGEIKYSHWSGVGDSGRSISCFANAVNNR